MIHQTRRVSVSACRVGHAFQVGASVCIGPNLHVYSKRQLHLQTCMQRYPVCAQVALAATMTATLRNMDTPMAIPV